MGYKVVDLGTKLGGALDEFRAEGAMYFGDEIKKIKPSECLGVELQDKYRKPVEAKGYDFKVQDLNETLLLNRLPDADYYIAWDALEHFAGVESSDRVLSVMLNRARLGVWLRMPSFESDISTGEGRLRPHGLRFSWTHWHGHKSHYTLAHVKTLVAGYNARTTTLSIWDTTVKSGRLIHSTLDRCVVPVSSPIDTINYSPNLGVKLQVEFSPPIVGQFEVILRREKT